MKRTGIIAVCVLAALLAGCGEEIPAETTQPTMETTVPATTLPEETLPPEALALTPWPEETADEYLLLQGTADPRYPIRIGDREVLCDENGEFSCQVPLEAGENRIPVTYLEETLEVTVLRRYTTAWFSHRDGKEFGSGGPIRGEIWARTGSRVTVTYGGKTQTLYPSDIQRGQGVPDGFQRYECRFNGPHGNKNPVSLGTMLFTVTCDGITETYETGELVALAAVKARYSDPSVTPNAAPYRDVGSGYIVEIVDVCAETFNGRSLDNKSHPEWNYLPKGTVDYGTQGTYYNTSADQHYYLLRCGVRVCDRIANKPLGSIPAVDCYYGTLPDHNELSVAAMEINGHHTDLVLDCLWKAPFYFDVEKQDYWDEDYWDRFNLETFDATYVDITFCYATVFEGVPEIGEDHPLFSSAELIWNEADCTLRLHLKKPGGFYGWSAVYNEAGQLCFKFLNPVTVTQGDNVYGADLSGVVILVDPGHGGHDPGSINYDSKVIAWEEKERNLVLAQLLKEELELMGAEVRMTRTESESNLTRSERIALLYEENPDYCISIHHNGDANLNKTGFDSAYYTPYTMEAAKHLALSTGQTDIYRRSECDWHFFYMSRQTHCPTVLAENGFMSNKWELDRIGDQAYMEAKAKALAQGIANYYLEQSGYPIP